MANPVKWSDSKAGYDPGQKQELTVTFSKRDTGKVTVNYKFYAKSLGRDDFVYKERHNKVTIWVGGTSTSFTYQLHGNKASTTKTGSFSITGVGNGTTSLKVEYRNQRIWVNAPSASWSPRSTGVVSKKKVGDLSISDNVKYNINYYSGYSNGNISNIPTSQKLYKGTTYKIPKNILVDNENHYVFNLGYTSSFNPEVNTANPAYKLDSSQTLTNNINYYACWYAQTYKYRFFTSNNFNKSYSDPEGSGDLVRYYKYASTSPTYLPNLNDYSSNNSVNNEYYKIGYKFNGWNSAKGNISVDDLGCRFDSDTNFYPDWSPIKSKIIFNYGFNSYTRELDYTYDTLFDFNFALKDESNEYKPNNLLRPGYKLIGWVYDESLSKTIYEPFKAPTVNFAYDSKQVVSLPTYLTNRQFEDIGLNLYAVWEYYTTLFVYTNNTWKLALPYVYIIKDNVPQWNIALTYGYAKDSITQNPSWKL